MINKDYLIKVVCGILVRLYEYNEKYKTGLKCSAYVPTWCPVYGELIYGYGNIVRGDSIVFEKNRIVIGEEGDKYIVFRYVIDYDLSNDACFVKYQRSEGAFLEEMADISLVDGSIVRFEAGEKHGTLFRSTLDAFTPEFIWRWNNEGKTPVEECKPKNNDGRKVCAWCMAPTRNYGVVSGIPSGQVCTKCGR